MEKERGDRKMKQTYCFKPTRTSLRNWDPVCLTVTSMKKREKEERECICRNVKGETGQPGEEGTGALVFSTETGALPRRDKELTRTLFWVFLISWSGKKEKKERVVPRRDSQRRGVEEEGEIQKV